MDFFLDFLSKSKDLLFKGFMIYVVISWVFFVVVI